MRRVLITGAGSGIGRARPPRFWRGCAGGSLGWLRGVSFQELTRIDLTDRPAPN